MFYSFNIYNFIYIKNFRYILGGLIMEDVLITISPVIIYIVKFTFALLFGKLFFKYFSDL